MFRSVFLMFRSVFFGCYSLIYYLVGYIFYNTFKLKISDKVYQINLLLSYIYMLIFIKNLVKFELIATDTSIDSILPDTWQIS